jgi:hypothetical protein
MALSQYYPRISLERLRKMMKNMNHDSQCPKWYSNREPTKYEARASLLSHRKWYVASWMCEHGIYTSLTLLLVHTVSNCWLQPKCDVKKYTSYETYPVLVECCRTNTCHMAHITWLEIPLQEVIDFSEVSDDDCWTAIWEASDTSTCLQNRKQNVTENSTWQHGNCKKLITQDSFLATHLLLHCGFYTLHTRDWQK